LNVVATADELTASRATAFFWAGQPPQPPVPIPAHRQPTSRGSTGDMRFTLIFPVAYLGTSAAAA